MERKIIKDVMFLKLKSSPAGKADIPTAIDLIDTLRANSSRCVGLAANMIGVRKNIIIVQTPAVPLVMMNPRMISHSEKCYEAEEKLCAMKVWRSNISICP